MAVDEQGRWKPNTAPKQNTLRSICQSHKIVLANGTRLSGKTVGCLHALVEHAWNTYPCNAAIITISQTVGMDSGVWRDLTEQTIPEWIDGNFGLKWVKRPFIQGVSKKPTLQISNKYGRTSTIQLESLQNEQEAERRFKPRRYSMIYVPELDTFKSRKTFDTWCETLRMIGLPDEQHLFLGDTNPADEGTRHWIYKVFYELLQSEDTDCDPLEIDLKRALCRVDFNLDDNPYVTESRKNELKSRYAHNKNLYDRYINGLWVTAATDSLFVDVFKPNIQVVGEAASLNNKFPLIMIPEENCSELITGWDLGVTNNAASLIEKATEIRGGKEVSVFKILDELVTLGIDITSEDFSAGFVKKMLFYEKILGRVPMWRHWSDNSAFNWKAPMSDRYQHQLVYEATGGKVTLMAAEKGKGSVRQRIDLFRRLLFEDRIRINAHCHSTIEMCQSIKRGRSSLAAIEKGSIHKHIFDAITYALSQECYDELNRSIYAGVRQENADSASFKSIAF